ncbi:MAG: AAC(3) family N-acetyltransferase [Cyanobium usitatum Tobar12.5m-G36]|nr:AAC(3) family N-acetyltransferase [Cyanobium usitatum Tobar12.5m-G36]
MRHKVHGQTNIQPYHNHLDPTTPLTRLPVNYGKILLFGTDYINCTLYHLSEEPHAVKKVFFKISCGVFVDGNRVVAPITQRYFVKRDILEK